MFYRIDSRLPQKKRSAERFGADNFSACIDIQGKSDGALDIRLSRRLRVRETR